MTFTETNLKGAFIVSLEEKKDQRGSFTRAFCAETFESYGLNPTIVQSNLSYNYKKGTLRGMHYQVAPAAETKLVRCLQGAIFDVIVDMRPDSATYLMHVGIELTAQNRLSLYVPAMFAHGYLTLTDDAEVMYHVSAPYTPACERGLRYDDPVLQITWPLPVGEVSQKDSNWPLLQQGTRV